MVSVTNRRERKLEVRDVAWKGMAQGGSEMSWATLSPGLEDPPAPRVQAVQGPAGLFPASA